MAAEELGMILDGGTLQRLPPNATKDQQTAVINDILDRLNNLIKTQVFSDGTSKRLLIGYQKGGFENGSSDFGIKMSREGVDVNGATEEELLFSMSIDNWTWRNNDGDVVKQFANQTGTDPYYDKNERNYVNIGLRTNPATYGFEMAKPSEDLGNDPS